MLKLVLILFMCCLSYYGNATKIPTFNKAYSVKGTLFIPYTELQETFTAWYDPEHNRSRIDYYEGTVKTFQLGNRYKYGTALRLTPVTTENETNVETCFQVNGTTDYSVEIQTVLPDLSNFKATDDDRLAIEMAI